MKPAPNESLLGFLKRRSDAEGFPEVGGFLHLIEHPYGRASVENAETLAKSLDLDLVDLEPLLPSSAAKDPALDWRFHRMKSDPICPCCLAGGLPRRKEWRHCLVSACALHGCELIDRCQACGKDMDIVGDGHLGCLCGTSYTSTETTIASEFEVQIARLIGGDKAAVAGTEIEAREDRHAARTLWFLASGLQRSTTGKPGKRAYPKNVAETRSLLEPIAPLLTDWPAAFDRHVIDRWADPEAEGLTAAARLGGWYLGLLKQTGLLAEVLLSRCLRVVGTVCGDAYKIKSDDENSEWVSAAQAAAQLGIRAERLVTAVQSGKIEGRQGRSGTGHLHTVIRQNEIAKVRLAKSLTLTKIEAREYLGVSRKQFELLLAAGIVRQIPDDERLPCVDGTYAKKDLLALTSKVRAGAKGSNGPDEPVVAFKAISLRKTTDRTALLSVFTAVADGRIAPSQLDEDQKLGDALFPETEVNQLLRDGGASNSLTATDVARLTGWKPECVTHWCSLGLIVAQKSKVGGADAWLIELSDLLQFKGKYLVLSEFAAEAGTTSRALLSRLAKHGIETTGSKTVGSTSRAHLLPIQHVAALLNRNWEPTV